MAADRGWDRTLFRRPTRSELEAKGSERLKVDGLWLLDKIHGDELLVPFPRAFAVGGGTKIRASRRKAVARYTVLYKREKLKLYRRPHQDSKNKFVFTEDAAFFLPYRNGADAPWFAEIFDLSNPATHRKADEELFAGQILLGHYDPFNNEVSVHVPLSSSRYIERRLREVFDV